MPDYLVAITYKAYRPVRVRAVDGDNAAKAACAILRAKPGLGNISMISVVPHLIPDEEDE